MPNFMTFSSIFYLTFDLNNYFDFHVCLFICPSVCWSVSLCDRKVAQFHAVVSQNITNESCLVCVKSENYAFWVILRPLQGSMRQGKAKLCTLCYQARRSQTAYIESHFQCFIPSLVSDPSSCVLQHTRALPSIFCKTMLAIQACGSGLKKVTFIFGGRHLRKLYFQNVLHKFQSVTMSQKFLQSSILLL